VPTQRNAARGVGSTNPRLTYSQQPLVEPSAEGLSWLSEWLQAGFDAQGKVPKASLDDLDWPASSLIPSPQS